MMKRAFLAFVVCMAAVVGFAQTDTVLTANTGAQSLFRVGYVSYSSLLDSMPQKYVVQRQIAELRSQYEQEMQRVEAEFNQKFETFLEERNDYPRTILLKRQNELQQLMQQNVEFRSYAQRELTQAEAEAMKPLHALLRQAIARAATACGVAFVLNTDNNSSPFIDPACGIDITSQVLSVLSELNSAPVE